MTLEHLTMELVSVSISTPKSSQNTEGTRKVTNVERYSLGENLHMKICKYINILMYCFFN